MVNKRLFFACLLITNLVLIGVAEAVTRVVGPPGSGHPYTSIQTAIGDAVSGVDEVLVHDGTYVENINFLGKAITVKSQNGAASATIDGANSGSVVTFDSGEGLGSVLEGFTVTGGSGSTIEFEGSFYVGGGGIFCNGSSPTITKCTIDKNNATDVGGGIQCWNSSPNITDCIISNNTTSGADGAGGGIVCAVSSSPTITNCTISGNSSKSGGGFFCVSSSSPTITHCTISNNTVTKSGGGITCDMFSSPTISNCTISGNSSEFGGGIYCYQSSPQITNCAISGNTATNGGGGMVFSDSSSPSIINCVITGNVATGISCNDFSTPSIVNTTIAHNNGGGVFCGSNSSITMVNSLIWGNENDPEIYVSSDSSYNITYSNIRGGGYTGTGNINASPKFVAPVLASQAPTPDGDYHLKFGSPCIDSADSSDPVPATDREGNARYDDPATDNSGAGSATYYDMGAYEYQGVSCPIYVPDDIPTIQEAIDAASEGCTIIVRNGTYTENINFNGKAITVKSENGAEVTTIDGSNPSDPDNGSVVTFTSGEGVGSVLDGFTITKGNGTLYKEPGPPPGPHGGGIICDNSSSPTIKNCKITNNSVVGSGGGILCSYFSSPVISGCTFSNNTANDSGGGIFIVTSSSPTISGCTFSNNIAGNNGGGIVVDGSSSAAITDCIISGNEAGESGGGIQCYESSATITNSIITDNTAAQDGGGIRCSADSVILTNCTISGNEANQGGGIVFNKSPSSSITNCVITGNKATVGGGGISCHDSSTPAIINSTIAGNNGGGINCLNSSTLTMANSIVWGNENNSEISVSSDSSYDITYSNIRGGGFTGTGNINTDPMFVAPILASQAPTPAGNYHLKPGSPCIDTGTAAGAPSDDIDGDSRPGDGKPGQQSTDGSEYDMGAYEYFAGCPHDGDVNGDGVVTSTDALSAFNHYLGINTLDACRRDRANVNGDDSITPADALCILKNYLGLGSCLD